MKKDKEFLEMIKGKTCEFEYKGRKCPSKELVGIARGKLLCKTHFKTVINDNNRRSRQRLDIPIDLVFTRELTISETWSKIRSQLNIGRLKWELK